MLWNNRLKVRKFAKNNKLKKFNKFMLFNLLL